MKKQMGIVLSFLLLFVVLSSQVEAAVTNGKVQYYYESSTDSNSSTSDTQSSTINSNTNTTSISQTSDMSENENHNGSPDSPNNRSRRSHSGITRFLQTNDQRNIFLVIIGILMIAIVFLGWRIVKNRRKNK